jgi:flagellar basal-body rod modification protein FlgD
LSLPADKIWNFTTSGMAPALVTATAAPTATGAQFTLNLTSAAYVTVTIRNLAGREIAVLTPGQLDAGIHSLLWNGKSSAGTKAPAGAYLLQVAATGADGARCSAVTPLRR